MARILLKIATVLIFTTIFLACDRKGEYSLSESNEVITDNGNGTGTATWTADKNYLLNGLVFINDGQVLTIEAGTVIRGKTGQGENASALIVARGGKIIAQGTAANPIIFTCEGDDLEGSVPLLSKGLWGGLIILGNAPLNIENNEAHIEGINITEPRGIYGGPVEEDNSGVLKYISIRHGGTNIGSGNEINGLTFGGVGSGTLVEHIEVISTYDDGIEFFGGTVNCRYIISAFNGDDAFDYDLGYQGMGQFWLGIQHPNEGDLIIEGNGGTDPELGLPYSIPIVYNGTFIGRGDAITNRTVQFSSNAGGVIANSIFMHQQLGVFVQFKQNSNDSYQQFQSGNLKLQNNIFWNIAGNTALDLFKVYNNDGNDVTTQNQVFANYFADGENTVSDPGIVTGETAYNVIPTGNISDNLYPFSDEWFLDVDYKGAFLYDNWAYNWSLLHQSGWLE